MWQVQCNFYSLVQPLEVSCKSEWVGPVVWASFCFSGCQLCKSICCFFFHPYSTALFDVLSKALMWHYSALSAAALAPKQCCVLVVKHDFMTRLASYACLGRHQWPGAILLSTLLGIYSLLFTRAFDVAPSLPSNFCAAALSRVLWRDWQALVSTASTSMSSCSKLLQQRNTRTSTEIN